MEAIVRKSIDEIFGVDASKFKAHGSQSTTMVRVFQATGDTPAANDGYIFQPDTLRRIMVWMASASLPPTFAKARMKRNLMIYGPTGCGKTELANQVCARTGRSLFRYQCSDDTEVSHLFGSWKLCRPNTNDGATPDATLAAPEMTYVDGPVLRWARTPNSILLLDEFDQLNPSVSMSLNGILDGADILVPETGERVKISQGCLIVATGNTNGRGSAGGNGGSAALYKGVKRQNIATLDRFFVIYTNYLSEAEEKELLRTQTGMAEKAAEAMAKLASAVRSQFLGLNEDAGAKGEPLEFTITTRNLQNWALTHRLLMAMGLDSGSAFTEGLRMTLLDFGTPAETQAVLDTWANIVGEV